MSQKLENLPLFLLNLVLFPFANLRIHVFEERYKLLVRDCIENHRPFGVVLIRSGEEVGELADPYMVGTACRIEHVDYLDDGRMDIQVHGLHRFRIRQIDESKPFPAGWVETIDEAEIADHELAEELIDQARTQFSGMIRRLFAPQQFNVSIDFPNDPVILSFIMANLLSIENLQKQRLLETTDTVERVEALLPILRSQSEQLDQAEGPRYRRVSSSEFADYANLN